MVEKKLNEVGMTKEDNINYDKNTFARNIRNAAIKLCLSVFIPLVVYLIIKRLTDVKWIFLFLYFI